MGLVGYAVVIVLSALTIQYMLKFNAGRVVLNQYPGPCHRVPNVDKGSEDIVVLPDGRALITSGLVLPSKQYFAKHESHGKVFLFDFKKPESGATEVKILGDFNHKEFFPHGMKIWRTNNDIFVYIVNHPYDKDTIDKFRFDPKLNTLTYIKSFSDPLWGVINNLVLIQEDIFYASNYMYTRNPFTNFLELLFVSWGQILFYDGKKYEIVLEGLRSPNGLNASPGGKYIYIAESGMGTVRTYARKSDNSLILEQSTSVQAAPDNIDVDENGDLWVSVFPIIWKGLIYLESDPTYPTPALVLRLKTKNGLVVSQEAIFSDDGNLISSSTIAARYKDAMLVGTVHSQLVYCQIKYLS